ncbi:hypothetical protein PVL29_014519 [Vitis rotundifolia]|uniref:Uncharacterized protein n=1 Tax=Vitis rotundifolia TaxID=103349 RepID=A0AA38ZID2_VITRO|nr:hypothetical protein PVL29_014519 [Vitis rotundifolia]
MKRKQLTITDLHFDVLKLIIVLVANSSNGAADLARTLSVSRVFMAFAGDRDILRVVVFDNLKLSRKFQSLQNVKGLIYSCAHAGNISAQYLLAKTLLLATSKLLIREKEYAWLQATSTCLCAECRAYSRWVAEEYTSASSSMVPFLHSRVLRPVSRPSLPHFILVRLFLERCSHDDLLKMRLYLNHYFEYFLGSGGAGFLVLFNCIKKMCIYGDAARCFERMAKDSIEMKVKAESSAKLSDKGAKGIIAVHSRMIDWSHQCSARQREMEDMLRGRREYDGEPLDFDKIFAALTKEFETTTAVKEECPNDIWYKSPHVVAIIFGRLEAMFTENSRVAFENVETNRGFAISLFDQLLP